MNSDFAKRLMSVDYYDIKYGEEWQKICMDTFFDDFNKINEAGQFMLCKEFIMNKRGKYFRRFPEGMRGNIEICKLLLTYTNDNYSNFRDMSVEIRNNKEICMLAAKIDGNNIQYMGEEMKNDEDVCMNAIYLTPGAIQYMSDAMKNNRKICAEVAWRYGPALQFMSNEMKNDFEICIAAINQYPPAAEFVSDELMNNREFCFQCVCRARNVLKYFPAIMRNDYEICKNASMWDSNNIDPAVSDELKNNEKFISSLLYESPFGKKWPTIAAYVCPLILLIKNLAALYACNEEFFNYGQNEKLLEYIYSHILERGSPRTATRGEPLDPK
jgi:hypothetical protein